MKSNPCGYIRLHIPDLCCQEGFIEWDYFGFIAKEPLLTL
jgi:hypothetical protein